MKIYDHKRDFYDGLAAVNIGFKDVLTDKIYDPREGYMRETISEGKWGFIDSSGIEVIPVMYDKAGNFSEGLALVTLGKEQFFIDKKGQKAFDFLYDTFLNFSEGLGVVRKSVKYGYINLKGQEVIPLIFDQAYEFREGVAQVEKNRMRGYINSSGEFEITPQFEDASHFVNGMASVRKNGKFGCINKKNELIVPFIADELGLPNAGVIETVQNDKYIYYNRFGRQITPPYNYSSQFYNSNFSIVGNGDGGKRWWPAHKLKNVKWGLIDNRGVEVIPLNFENYEDVVAEMRKLEQT